MKPILFNTEMVQAIMDGRKTVTRRVIKPQPDSKLSYVFAGSHKSDIRKWHNESMTQKWNPPYHADDILYVRETWRVRNVYGDLARGDRTAEIEFKAGGENSKMKITVDVLSGPWWNPSIHMPKEAARIFLRVKRVSVERLQDIDDDGVVAEGLDIGDPFDELWDSTIKPANREKYGWDANPWVWVIEFERCNKPKEE